MKHFAAIFTLCALPATAALAQSITLGTAGSVVGSMGVNNATSGTITVTPPTGALGTPTLTWPTTTGTLALSGTGSWLSSNPSLTAAQFNQNCPIYTINASSLNINLPSAATLQANGGCLYVSNPTANTYTVTPNGSDNLNGANAAKTFGPQTLTLVTSDGSTNDAAITPPSISGGNAWSGMQSAGVTTLTISTATFTPNGTNNNYKIALTSACPCTVANPSVTPVAGTSGIIEIDQDGTGSRTVGTWGSQYYTAGGVSSITLSTGANATDFFSYFVKDSTHIIIQPSVLNATH